LESLKQGESISSIGLRPAESVPVVSDSKEKDLVEKFILLIVATWSLPMLALWLFKAFSSDKGLHGD
jgi:hypothetical protein